MCYETRAVSIEKYFNDPNRILRADKKRARFYLKKHKEALADYKPMQEVNARSYNWAVDFLKANGANHQYKEVIDDMKKSYLDNSADEAREGKKTSDNWHF